MDKRTPPAADRLPALRERTRTELCERLLRARAFMDANYNEKLPLSTVAEIAFMSRHHFLRQFKLAFGITPHRYVIGLRLDKARHALVSGEQSVSEICRAVGFESLGSFSWLFKRNFGLSPEHYRRKIGASSATAG